MNTTTSKTTTEIRQAIYIPRPAAMSDEELLPMSEADLLTVGADRTRIGPLVPFPEGNPGGFARAIKRESGIKDFHVHRCRHQYAIQWVADGGSRFLPPSASSQRAPISLLRMLLCARGPVAQTDRAAVSFCEAAVAVKRHR